MTTTPESVVIYDGKIPEGFDESVVAQQLELAAKATCATILLESSIEFTIANVTIILDFDEGTIGVLAPAEGEA